MNFFQNPQRTDVCGSCGMQEQADKAGTSQDSPQHVSYTCRACRGLDTGERWILEERSRNGNWRRIPKSDTFETGEDAQVELGRYSNYSTKRRDAFRVRRLGGESQEKARVLAQRNTEQKLWGGLPWGYSVGYKRPNSPRNKRLEENPDGGLGAFGTGVLVLAAVGITYLMFREKPGKEPEPAPTPPPAPPPPPAPVIPPVFTFVPAPTPPVPGACLVTLKRFKAWVASKGWKGVWLDNVQTTPPILSVLKTDNPDVADTPWNEIAVATNGGEKLWYYEENGEPYTHGKIRIAFCVWLANNP